MSARGWAFGYLGGGLALALQLALYLGHDSLGMESEHGRAALLPALGHLVGRLHDHSAAQGCTSIKNHGGERGVSALTAGFTDWAARTRRRVRCSAS